MSNKIYTPITSGWISSNKISANSIVAEPITWNGHWRDLPLGLKYYKDSGIAKYGRGETVLFVVVNEIKDFTFYEESNTLLIPKSKTHLIDPCLSSVNSANTFKISQSLRVEELPDNFNRFLAKRTLKGEEIFVTYIGE